MPRKIKLTVSQILPLIFEKRGNLASVARAVGVTRQAIQYRVKASTELTAAYEEAAESMLDAAESKLFEAIDEGDRTAIIFFLKTKGYRRGYVERKDFDWSTFLKKMGLDPSQVVSEIADEKISAESSKRGKPIKV